MRRAILAILIVTTFVTGRLPAEPGSAESPSIPPDVGPGRIAWFDITSSNLSQSRTFYGKLFDWTFRPVQGTDQALEIVAEDTAIGTLRVAEGTISAFNGVVYVQVADVRAGCEKVKELGGTVAPGFPFNLPDEAGAVALILDPTGHPLGMYSRKTLPAAMFEAK